MSKTYRKPAVLVEMSEVEFINRELKWAQYSNIYRIQYNKKYPNRPQKELLSYEQVVKEAKADWNTFSRDGAQRSGSRCKYFSDLCARDLRAKTRQYLSRKRWDEEMPPDRKNGKSFIWNVW